MNEGLRKFDELLKTDAAFQEKLKAAVESYTGEKTEEAVFEAVLVPLAKEYGITASFEEYKEYVSGISNDDRELSEDEINQVAGGSKGAGLGFSLCYGWGLGIGSADGSKCLGVGAGGETGICAGAGVGTS